MPDANRSLPESILSLFAGRERAAAIVGDLTEMAATRGRLWFAAAYVRTLVSLGWRAPVAFLCAYICTRHNWMGAVIFGSLRLFHRIPPNDPAHTGHRSQFFLVSFLIALNLVLPFVLVRFGLRNRLAQLATAIFLLTIPLYSLTLGGMKITDYAIAATVLAALSLPAWRRPMIVLAATVAPVVVVTSLWPHPEHFLYTRGYGFTTPQLLWIMVLYRTLELCIMAIVCSFLYRRLLQQKPTDLGTIA
ncbi:MAG: hypothetical protein ACLQM6_13690 [Acidobacteriaceae bacterium]